MKISILKECFLGMSKYDITKKLDHIIRFADIKQFIDTPLFTYSSGMKLRLDFAIAIHADSDILMLDEGLSVGDDFQKKSQQKLQTFFRKNITVLIASHLLEYIQITCWRVIILGKGILTGDASQKLTEQYLRGDYL